MKARFIPHSLVISGAIALVLILANAPTTRKSPETDARPAASVIDKLTGDAKNQLSEGNKRRIDSLEAAVKESEPGTGFRELAAAWDKAGVRALAAHYYEKNSVLNATEENWLNAAYRYFDAFKMTEDSLQKAYMVQHAIEAYSKVLELNPSNLNAKTDLGICYAEGTQEPMKGISLLREVVTENPQHENAQLSLGILSLRSGQLEKAVERFNKVLEVNPANLDMYIFIGETLERMGKIREATDSYKKFVNLSKDPDAVQAVNEHISQIEKNL